MNITTKTEEIIKELDATMAASGFPRINEEQEDVFEVV